ncbi:hypothetical protein ABVT39_020207 [Epinephelus coioides]
MTPSRESSQLRVDHVIPLAKRFFEQLSEVQRQKLRDGKPDEATRDIMADLLMDLVVYLADCLTNVNKNQMVTEESVASTLGNVVPEAFAQALGVNDQEPCDSSETLTKMMSKEISKSISSSSSSSSSSSTSWDARRLTVMVAHACSMIRSFMRNASLCCRTKRVDVKADDDDRFNLISTPIESLVTPSLMGNASLCCSTAHVDVKADDDDRFDLISTPIESLVTPSLMGNTSLCCSTAHVDVKADDDDRFDLTSTPMESSVTPSLMGNTSLCCSTAHVYLMADDDDCFDLTSTPIESSVTPSLIGNTSLCCSTAHEDLVADNDDCFGLTSTPINSSKLSCLSPVQMLEGSEDRATPAPAPAPEPAPAPAPAPALSVPEAGAEPVLHVRPDRDLNTEKNKICVQILVEKLVTRVYNKAKVNIHLKDPHIIINCLFEKIWAEVQGGDYDITPETFKSLDKTIFKDLCRFWGCAELVLVSLCQEQPEMDYAVCTFARHLKTPQRNNICRFFSSLGRVISKPFRRASPI